VKDTAPVLMDMFEEPDPNGEGLRRVPVLLRYRPALNRQTYSLLDVPYKKAVFIDGQYRDACRLAFAYTASSKDNEKVDLVRTCTGPFAAQSEVIRRLEFKPLMKLRLNVDFRGRVMDPVTDREYWEPFEFVAFPQTRLEPGETFQNKFFVGPFSSNGTKPTILRWEYEGVRTVRGVECAQLRCQGGWFQLADKSFPSYVWVRADTGQTVEARKDSDESIGGTKATHVFRYFSISRP
jgi:hypothetical protein